MVIYWDEFRLAQVYKNGTPDEDQTNYTVMMVKFFCSPVITTRIETNGYLLELSLVWKEATKFRLNLKITLTKGQ